MHPKQTEEIERLRDQSRRIANGELLPEVVASMRGRLPQLGKNLFLINHIPEQGENIYVFAVDYRSVITVEVSKHGDPTEIGVTSMHQYRSGLCGKSTNRKLDAIRIIMLDLQGKEQN